MKKSHLLVLVSVISCLVASVGLSEERLGPFTKKAQSVRSRSFDQKHVRLELDFNWDRRQVRGRAVHTLAPFKPISRLEFDAVDLDVDKVTLLDADPPAELKHETRGGKLSVTLSRAFRPEDVINLLVTGLVPSFLAASLCCLEGLSVPATSSAIPLATRRALSHCVLGLFLVSVPVSVLTYL